MVAMLAGAIALAGTCYPGIRATWDSFSLQYTRRRIANCFRYPAS